MKQSHPFLVYFFLFAFLFAGCASTHKSQSTPLTRPKIPQQSPSVIITSPPKIEIDNKNAEKLTQEFSLIESSFLAQNCDSVLEHARILQGISSFNDFSYQPPIIRAAVYTCDAKAGLSDPARLKLAISNLKTIPLRYPFINEAWLHNTLADFYIALDDKQNAIMEKKQARDLLLAQQQDISILSIDILKLDPNEQNTVLKNTQTPDAGSSQSPNIDQIISSATQLINNDTPEQAIALLDSIPSAQRPESVKRLRTEAVNNLVTNLRFKVRALFVRSTEQTGQGKKESLQQCEQILKGIIQSYPEYQDMPAILNNLKQVQRELNKK